MEARVFDRMYACKDNHWWFVNHRLLVSRLIERFSKPGAACKILDAGCGPGVMLRKLREYGWTVGLDYSELALGYCLRDNGKPLCRGSVSSLPFKKNSFDFVIIADVLYHHNVRDDGLAMREIYASLKDGGIAIFHEPAFEFLRRKHDVAEHTARRYTIRRLKRKAHDAGFRVVDTFYANNLIFVPVLFVKIAERFIDLWRGAGSDLIVVPPVINRMFTCLVKLETRVFSRLKLPFGVTVVCVASKG